MTPAFAVTLVVAFVVSFLVTTWLLSWWDRRKRLKRPEGWNRYDLPPQPPNTLRIVMSGEAAQRLLRDLTALDAEDQDAALHDLMCSIDGRFTSRSEEPDDA